MIKRLLQQLIVNPNTSSEDINVLDDRWYEKMREYGSFQAYKFFDGNNLYREKQKELFLNDEIRNPKLDYPLVDDDELAEIQSRLQDLLTTMDHEEEDELVRNTYKKKIKEKGAEIRLVQLARKMEMTTSENDKKDFAQEFKKTTEELYGRPTKKVFEYAITKMRAKAEALAKKNELAGLAAKDILLILPKYKPNSLEPALAKSKLEKYIIRYLMLDDVLKRIDLQDVETELKAEEIKKYFEQFVTALNLTGWTVEVSNNIPSISIDQRDKLVMIPKNRRLKASKLRLLLVHEIGVHVRRREHGERSQLKLLGLGLAGYEVGEEGLAGVCEDILKTKTYDVSFGALIGYVAVGLVYGLDGTKRDFRDLYEILHKFYRFKIIKNLKSMIDIDLNEIEIEAQNKAWQRCIRVFRGTNGSEKGVCFTKDIIYLKGRICVLDHIRNESEEIGRLFKGKYDPCNPNHKKLLDELGM